MLSGHDLVVERRRVADLSSSAEWLPDGKGTTYTTQTCTTHSRYKLVLPVQSSSSAISCARHKQVVSYWRRAAEKYFAVRRVTLPSMRLSRLPSGTARPAVVLRRPSTTPHAVAPPVSAKRSFGFTYTPPPFEPESPPRLEVDLPLYDAVECRRVDVAIAGAGPAGVATAARIASQGLSVVIVDPSPLQHWPNNYGVWCDEFEAMGLDDCFERVWTKANVWIRDGDERYAVLQSIQV